MDEFAHIHPVTEAHAYTHIKECGGQRQGRGSDQADEN